MVGSPAAIQEPSTPSPRLAKPLLGSARPASPVPRLALGGMLPLASLPDPSAPLSSRQSRPTSRFYEEHMAQIAAPSPQAAAAPSVPKLAMAGSSIAASAPQPNQPSKRLHSHLSVPQLNLSPAKLPFIPRLASLPIPQSGTFLLQSPLNARDALPAPSCLLLLCMTRGLFSSLHLRIIMGATNSLLQPLFH